MREIMVFDDGTIYTLRWLRALVWARREFLEQGFRVRFNLGSTLISRKPGGVVDKASFEEVKDLFQKGGKDRYDIVFMAYHWDCGFLSRPEDEIIELLNMIKNRSNILVWLDTADSTGTCNFQYIPYVDFYLKKQLLKDRRRYLKPIWGGRIHSEYYHNTYGINYLENKEHVKSVPLKEEDISKLRLSWNVGCGNLPFFPVYTELLHPLDYANYKFFSPNTVREFDIHYRGSAWSTSVAGYQRGLTIEALDKAEGIKIPDVRSKISHNDYVNELKHSKLVCSPFGWGEICTRDFEAFLYGAALIKPDMGHLITYPNWYLPGITYVPIRWDFSDFSDIINDVKHGNIDKYKDIAIKGQEQFKGYMATKKGKESFAKHILSQIEVIP